MTQGHLVKYESARRALAAARDYDEVKDLRDKAEAMAAYARQARDTQLVELATEIKVRAERRCGEMLVESATNGSRRKSGNPQLSKAATIGLADLGISRDESSRYQRLAAMPDKHFEAAVETAKAAVGEVTTAFLLREARTLLRPLATPSTPLPRAQQMQETGADMRAELAEYRAWEVQLGFATRRTGRADILSFVRQAAQRLRALGVVM